MLNLINLAFGLKQDSNVPVMGEEQLIGDPVNNVPSRLNFRQTEQE